MKIIISLSDGMVERNLLKTDFWSYLTQEKELEIILISSSNEYFNYLAKRYTSPMVKVVYEQYSIGLIDAFLSYLTRNSIHSCTIKEEQYSQRKGINGQKKISFLTYCSFRLCWYLGKYYWWRKFLRFLYRHLSSCGYAESVLRREKPDLVFVPSINPSDYKMIWQARRQNVRCVQMIKSWDNLSSKTFMAVLPDYLVVHNKIIRDEAVYYGDMPKDKIFISGIPQFDYLVSKRDEILINREEFYADLGIDSSQKVILFSASGDRISPHDGDYLLMLDEAIVCGSLPHDTHIHVRLHPKYDSNLKGVEKLKHVTVERPFSYLTKDHRDWIFEEKDMKRWYNSLYHSAMVVNVASTMAIDAAVVERPIISLGFDGYGKLPLSQSVSRYYDRDHYRNVIKTDAVLLVRSEQEFINAVRCYLKNPLHKENERRKLVEQQCYEIDGNASSRLADFLLNLVKG